MFPLTTLGNSKCIIFGDSPPQGFTKLKKNITGGMDPHGRLSTHSVIMVNMLVSNPVIFGFKVPFTETGYNKCK